MEGILNIENLNLCTFLSISLRDLCLPELGKKKLSVMSEKHSGCGGVSPFFVPPGTKL